MKLTPAPQQMVDLFESVRPGPPAETRKMFGYPAAFVNRNMFMGLFQDQMMLRLSDSDRVEFMKSDGAKVFEPMPGRPMREYVTIPRSVLNNRAKLASWISKSMKYAESLPAKAAKARNAKAKPTPKKSASGRPTKR